MIPRCQLRQILTDAQKRQGRSYSTKHYLNPTIDYYTCTYYGTGAHIGASYFDRILFDNCTRSLVPPTVTLNASPSTLPQGSSSMLTWTVANATPSNQFVTQVGAIPAMNGSQLVHSRARYYRHIRSRVRVWNKRVINNGFHFSAARHRRPGRPERSFCASTRISE